MKEYKLVHLNEGLKLGRKKGFIASWGLYKWVHLKGMGATASIKS